VTPHNVIFVTERGARHQRNALEAAPEILDVTMLRRPDKETLKAHLSKAEYLISERRGVIDADVIRAGPKVKLIVRLGSLYTDIDLEAAKAAGVAVCYWPVESTILVAEHALLQMLAVTKRLRKTVSLALEAGDQWGEARRTDEDVFAFNWARVEDVEGLWGKTVGIVGLGEVGAELARRLRGFGCRVLYNKRSRLPEGIEAELGVTFAERETLFAESDVVANLLPYFESHDLSIGADLIGRMKPGAHLVSSGSGSVIDEGALAEALEAGKLAGAALDTFEWEPLRPDNPLLALARAGHNVLLTPHVAGGGAEAALAQISAYYTNVVNHVEGHPLQYQVA
jgi:lactate dehydrogenase-like 2-hydroxyacid dehydrogenase